MRKSRRTRLAALVREHAALETRTRTIEDQGRVLSEVIATLPIGVMVRTADDEVVLENPLMAAPTPDVGMNALIREEAVSAAADCFRSGAGTQRELSLHGPPSFVFEITTRLLADRSVVCLVADVSERRRLADMRRDFTINASHELRTPVGAIALLAETLEDETDPANIKTLTGHLVREAERARGLLEGVLDLARSEAGQRDQPSEVDLGWVARQAVERLAPLAGEAAVEIRLAGAEPAVCVAGYGEQLVSAVTNLIDNAIKYSPGGGTVSVSVTGDDSWATIAVADEGAGIPARDLDRIFERFYRVDRGRDRRTGGTGLGLSIVRHVADNHGGHVTVDSTQGHGSTFRLVLPVSA